MKVAYEESDVVVKASARLKSLTRVDGAVEFVWELAPGTELTLRTSHPEAERMITGTRLGSPEVTVRLSP